MLKKIFVQKIKRRDKNCLISRVTCPSQGRYSTKGVLLTSAKDIVRRCVHKGMEPKKTGKITKFQVINKIGVLLLQTGERNENYAALKKISVRGSTYLYIVPATCSNEDLESRYL